MSRVGGFGCHELCLYGIRHKRADNSNNMISTNRSTVFRWIWTNESAQLCHQTRPGQRAGTARGGEVQEDDHGESPHQHISVQAAEQSGGLNY